MKMESLQAQTSTKATLRAFWGQKRSEIPNFRREEAELAAFAKISELAAQHRYVLSYASFGSELSTQDINAFLREAGKLLLPKVSGSNLRIYHVEKGFKCGLTKNRWGIPEPEETECREADLASVSAVFVPGLAFDKRGHRLGYGKGYYDRLLSSLAPGIPFYGLGFKEQLHPSLLPAFPNDVPLTALLLF
jgi:5-formyltetrahydrofolate cyclo-ligase